MPNPNLQVELTQALLEQFRSLKNCKTDSSLDFELQKARGLVMVTNQIQNVIKTTAQVAFQSENVNIEDKKMVTSVMTCTPKEEPLRILSKQDKDNAIKESWKDED